MTTTHDVRRVHAFGDDALADHDAVEVAALIRRGEISVEEAECAAVARVRTVEPTLNAVAFAAYESPRRGTDPCAPLYGVPTLVKDNTEVAGMPTNHGTDAFRARPARTDGRYARQLLSTGVTVLGKTRMPEFGFNATSEFRLAEPVRNPWNLDYSSGASSGGAAALVAAGALPLAHGNDGGGSIRIPAAAAGLIGLKPSRGRHVDGEAARAMPINIVSEGVLSRSVRDTAAYVAATEACWRNRRLPPIGLVEGPARRRLRVGVLTEHILGGEVDTQTLAAVDKTVALLEAQGHVAEPISLPVDSRFAEDFTLYWGLLASLATGFGRVAFDRSFDSGQIDGLTRGLRRYYARNIARTPGAFRRLRRTGAQYARLFDRHELIVSPVVSHVTPRLGVLSPCVPFDELIQRLRNFVAFTPLQNVTGTPAISLPMAMADEGVPVGVQVASAFGDERTLLEVAFALEEATVWPRIHNHEGC
ncbi:amidase [Nocardia transvalensis]|uniref:amidase n=1 Tax=Nocardia transvalensis TaxID=37333 RepID=A0A7W9PJL2_9NOCA|nr:amidase [Nocardia transvalensis]MBB5916799.1 amidase [Nocardia transvalensis]